jgi:hypothetical protein
MSIPAIFTIGQRNCPSAHIFESLMKQDMKAFLSFLLATLFFSHQGESQDIAFTNVNVISMRDSGIARNKTVVVRNNKVIAIEDFNAKKSFKNARVVDAKGAFLLPGFFDMHMHFYHDFGLDKKFLKDEVKLPLVNGVTTVRIMNGRPEYLQLKKEIADRKIPGPEMFVASPQLVGRWPFKDSLVGKIVSNAKEAGDAVQSFKAEGYDAIKITTLVNADAYNGIVTTARNENIKVTGHVGPLVRLDKALAAHQQIEHFDEFIETLLPDTSFNHGNSVSDYGIWDRKKAWPTIEFVDENKISELARKVKAADIYVTPTNYFFTKFFAIGATNSEIEEFPQFNYVPAFMKKRAEDAFNHFWNNPPSEELRKKYLRVRYQFVTAMHRAGVKLMTGSDSPEWYLMPGFTVHDEIESFVKAGLSPYAALQSATINPAEYLGISNRKGTIEVGKEAEFILLNKNPLEDIRNTRTIVAVYSHGKLYDRAALDQMLNEIKSFSTE